jgi:hypothetical protein
MGTGKMRITRTLMWLMVPLLAACAAAEPMPGDAAGVPGETSIVVQNDHTNRRDLIVYLEPEGRGERRQLGRVAAGQTGTFSVEAERGFYRLIAAHDLGDMRSSRFNLLGPSTVRWQLSVDRVLVNRR